jgi:hypothetical protein
MLRKEGPVLKLETELNNVKKFVSYLKENALRVLVGGCHLGKY